MRIVVALGGNALARRGEPISANSMRENVRKAVAVLAPVALGHDLVVTHGNGPQVGLLALQNLAYTEVEAYPLDILGAQTQGMLGYVVGQELLNAIGLRRELATILTTTEVDPNDPAYSNPTKFVGPVYSREEAERLAKRWGWSIAQDGDWWRRVVPSPTPLRIRQADTIRKLIELGLIVVCVGGGGVPTVVDHERGHLTGSEAVVDKDLASAVLGHDLKADLLLLLTDADAVYLHWGTSHQQAVRSATPQALRRFGFAAGSMAPKIDAAAMFVADGHGRAVIGSLQDIDALIGGRAGTTIDGRATGDMELYERR